MSSGFNRQISPANIPQGSGTPPQDRSTDDSLTARFSYGVLDGPRRTRSHRKGRIKVKDEEVRSSESKVLVVGIILGLMVFIAGIMRIQSCTQVKNDLKGLFSRHEQREGRPYHRYRR